MLKPDFDYHVEVDLTRFYKVGAVTEAITTKGHFAVLATATSGVGLDAIGVLPTYEPGMGNGNTVEVVVNPSGKVPIGVLCQDVKNEQTSEPRRWDDSGNTSYPGRKAGIVRKGWIVTDAIDGRPGAGDPAYMSVSGTVAPTGAAGCALVGKFETSKDADGFSRFYVNL